jgi:Protein of unknown function (DUF3300)
MKSFLKSLVVGLLAVTLTGPVAIAQERPAFSEEELNQMLAPIALYPDSLLSQILMASTYPLEVVQAARWSRANSRLQGEDAVKAVEAMDWDPSVKSLVAFPQILHRMDERLDWTQRLGEAFLAQEPHVLDTIQGLRQKAAAAGNLNSTEQMRVMRQDEAILIEPARPEAVYVPYYNPAVVYGPWGYPAYPPVYWGPFPGYYAGYWPGFFWGPAIVVSTGFFFGHCNFHHRHVTVSHKHVVTQSRFGKPITTVTPLSKPVAWQHNPVHRKGVPYRHASLQKDSGRFGGVNRGDGRDYHRPDAAQSSRDSGRPGGLRDGRQDERRDAAAGQDKDRREGAPSRFSSPQGGSKSTAPAAPSQQRPSDSGSGNSRFQGRTLAPRSDSNGSSNVLRFQKHGTAPQAAPVAPVARQERGPDAASGNNVHRFQGRVPAPQPAPAAPVARQDQRPAAAAPQRNAQPGALRQQQVRPPQAAGQGDRGQAARQIATPQRSAPAPAPRAHAGNSAPRMAHGNGSLRGGGNGGSGGGGNGGRGGGSFR